MNYIIDPKLFYLSGICENIYTTLMVLSILSLLFFTIIILFSADNGDCKWGIVGLIISLCVLIIAQFIPDKETCYAIMVAKMATVENVEFTIEKLKSLVDYIAEVCAK